MRLQLLALTLAALPVAACSPELQPVTINFHALVGSRDFACGQSYAGLGSAATMVQPADFRLYIHNVRLVDQTGAERPLTLDQDQLWQYEDVALLDFENKVAPCDGTAAINTTVRGQAAGSGGYTGVRFAVGIPPELNHGNQATAPSPAQLQWPVLDLAGRLQVPPHRGQNGRRQRHLHGAPGEHRLSARPRGSDCVHEPQHAGRSAHGLRSAEQAGGG